MNIVSISVLKILRKLYAKAFGGYQLPPLQREENPEKISNLIYDLLVSDKPCMIARFGSTEMLALVNYLGVNSKKHSILDYIKGKQPAWWWNKNVMDQMQQWSGFFPPTPNNMQKFGDLMINDAKEIDLLGSWILNENYIFPYIKSDVKKVWLIFLDPFWVKRPWTKALQGKKVLVIHPFAKLIEKQYKEKRNKLFVNEDILPEFELKTIEAVQSLGGKSDIYKNWFEALESMQHQMDSVDYDICLLGCGAYGFPLAAHSKRMGKKAVHIGGSLQLLFGIIGHRWEDLDYAKAARRVCPSLSYHSLFNSYWVRPLEFRSEITKKVENNCYW